MTEEQTALLDKARESLRAAKVLAREGYHDFSVSRAYYTMFYLAKALLLAEGVERSKHSGVIAAFGEHLAKPDKVHPRFHRYLLDAEDNRVISDYQTSSGFSAAQVEETIQRAAEFVEMAIAFLGSRPSSRDC